MQHALTLHSGYSRSTLSSGEDVLGSTKILSYVIDTSDLNMCTPGPFLCERRGTKTMFASLGFRFHLNHSLAVRLWANTCLDFLSMTVAYHRLVGMCYFMKSVV